MSYLRHGHNINPGLSLKSKLENTNKRNINEEIQIKQIDNEGLTNPANIIQEKFEIGSIYNKNKNKNSDRKDKVISLGNVKLTNDILKYTNVKSLNLQPVPRISCVEFSNPPQLKIQTKIEFNLSLISTSTASFGMKSMQNGLNPKLKLKTGNNKSSPTRSISITNGPEISNNPLVKSVNLKSSTDSDKNNKDNHYSQITPADPCRNKNKIGSEKREASLVSFHMAANVKKNATVMQESEVDFIYKKVFDKKYSYLINPKVTKKINKRDLADPDYKYNIERKIKQVKQTSYIDDKIKQIKEKIFFMKGIFDYSYPQILVKKIKIQNKIMNTESDNQDNKNQIDKFKYRFNQFTNPMILEKMNKLVSSVTISNFSFHLNENRKCVKDVKGPIRSSLIKSNRQSIYAPNQVTCKKNNFIY